MILRHLQSAGRATGVALVPCAPESTQQTVQYPLVGSSGSCLIVRRTRSESRISNCGGAAFHYLDEDDSGCGLWWYL